MELNTRKKYRDLDEKCYKRFHEYLHSPGVKYWTISVLRKDVQLLIQTLNWYACDISYCIDKHIGPDEPCIFVYEIETGCLNCMKESSALVDDEIRSKSKACSEEDYTYFIREMEANAIRLTSTDRTERRENIEYE